MSATELLAEKVRKLDEDTAREVLAFLERDARKKEPFPPGSLRKYFTAETDAEELALLKGCSLETSE